MVENTSTSNFVYPGITSNTTLYGSALNINGEEGSYEGADFDVVQFGCSYELKDQKTLNKIEGEEHSGQLNFAHYMQNEYCIEKSSLILECKYIPFSQEDHETAKRILRILRTIERMHK